MYARGQDEKVYCLCLLKIYLCAVARRAVAGRRVAATVARTTKQIDDRALPCLSHNPWPIRAGNPKQNCRTNLFGPDRILPAISLWFFISAVVLMTHVADKEYSSSKKVIPTHKVIITSSKTWRCDLLGRREVVG